MNKFYSTIAVEGEFSVLFLDGSNPTSKLQDFDDAPQSHTVLVRFALGVLPTGSI